MPICCNSYNGYIGIFDRNTHKIIWSTNIGYPNHYKERWHWFINTMAVVGDKWLIHDKEMTLHVYQKD